MGDYMVRNPVPHCGIDNADEVPSIRNLTCRSYNSCLTDVCDNGWPGFSCQQCVAFESLDENEKIRDHDATLELLAASISQTGYDNDDPLPS